MISFYAEECCQAYGNLRELEHRLELLEDGETPLPTNDATEASQVIGTFLRECQRAGLKRPLDRTERLRYFGEPGRDQSRYTLNMLRRELEELREGALTDLRERTFLRLDESTESHYEKAALFGSLVSQEFSKADYDIREAGNCYATGRYTACVFHLMRVAEHGLRALAKKVRVPFPKTFDSKTWGELIGDIENEIGKLKPRSSGAKDLEFYNAAAAQFRYFKNGWRNHVMHTRTNYNEAEALIVMHHLREFMQHLATRIRQ